MIFDLVPIAPVYHLKADRLGNPAGDGYGEGLLQDRRVKILGCLWSSRQSGKDAILVCKTTNQLSLTLESHMIEYVIALKKVIISKIQRITNKMTIAVATHKIASLSNSWPR
jgi:hypothetical protein